jgi:hypothetical protein
MNSERISLEKQFRRNPCWGRNHRESLPGVGCKNRILPRAVRHSAFSALRYSQHFDGCSQPQRGCIAEPRVGCKPRGLPWEGMQGCIQSRSGLRPDAIPFKVDLEIHLIPEVERQKASPILGL